MTTDEIDRSLQEMSWKDIKEIAIVALVAITISIIAALATVIVT